MSQTLVKVKQETDADQLKRAFVKVTAEVAQEIKQDLTLEDLARFKPLIEHLKITTEDLNQWLEDEDLFWPFNGLSKFYREQGLYKEAIPYLEQCLTITEQRLGNEHPTVTSALNNLGSLYESQGKYSEAEPLLVRSLSIREKQLGPVIIPDLPSVSMV